MDNSVQFWFCYTNHIVKTALLCMLSFVGIFAATFLLHNHRKRKAGRQKFT